MKVICGLFLMLCSLLAAAQPSIAGKWVTEKEEAIVEITEQSNEFTGKIISLKHPVDRNGKQKRDIKNDDPKLRIRPLVGIPVVYGMRYNEAKQQWEGGRVYIPRFGKEISAVITLVDPVTIKIKGYLGVGRMAHTQTWVRKK